MLAEKNAGSKQASQGQVGSCGSRSKAVFGFPAAREVVKLTYSMGIWQRGDQFFSSLRLRILISASIDGSDGGVFPGPCVLFAQKEGTRND